VRDRVHGTVERPRLAVFRSLKHIYAQLVDDDARRTLAAAGTLDAELRGALNGTGNVAAAEAVGRLLAQRATAAGVSKVVFDRSGYRYHGRVKAVAEGARAAGLEF